MTQEDKKLLIKELCTRLPYHVFVQVSGKIFYGTELAPYQQPLTYGLIEKLGDLTIKPYLRPMSSMTEEEASEYNSFSVGEDWISNPFCCVPAFHVLDWLNAHHFDYRGLIEKGLALEAKEFYNNIANEEN